MSADSSLAVCLSFVELVGWRSCIVCSQPLPLLVLEPLGRGSSECQGQLPFLLSWGILWELQSDLWFMATYTGFGMYWRS